MSLEIRFRPDNLAVVTDGDENLVTLAAAAGITLRGACGGAGTCNRCRVRLAEGSVIVDGERHVSAPAEIGACRSKPLTNLVIEVPEQSRVRAHQVVLGTAGDQLDESQGEGVLVSEPLYRTVPLALSAPNVDDSGDDLGRVLRALTDITAGPIQASLEMTRDVPRAARSGNWTVEVDLADAGAFTEISAVRPGGQSLSVVGLAVDLGTTTVACELVDLTDGTVIVSAGDFNRQAAFGDDIISRAIYAESESNGLQRLRLAAVDTVNGILEKMYAASGVSPDAVRCVYVAGNPTMAHLFAGVNPGYLRMAPYVPAVNEWPPFRATEMGLRVHPAAWVHLAPGVASYLGGDITAGLASARVAESDLLTLFVDIGTNGEMVLGNREWLVGCACSAGPAFEGGGINHGMRAVNGAIETLDFTPGGYEVFLRTIADLPARGVCGSGLIDAVAGLRAAGVIDRAGRFSMDSDNPRLREGREGREFVLVWSRETQGEKDLVLTEGDLRNIVRAKAAVFAGVRAMLGAVGLEMGNIQRVLIAGGFGKHLRLSRAVGLGMLPDLPAEKYVYLGNTSLRGAREAMLSGMFRKRIKSLARSITYIDLSGGTSFMDEYMSALFIPHTEVSLFPSVEKG